MSTPLPRRRAARTEAIWTLSGFALISTALFVAIDTRYSHWYDEEYAKRREQFQARVAEEPDRPVLMVVGSSRILCGFLATEVGDVPDPATGQRALVLHNSHLGSGARMNLMLVDRCVRDGVRPKWVVIELVPGILFHEALHMRTVSMADLKLILPFTNQGRVIYELARERVNIVYNMRMNLLRNTVPALETVVDAKDVVRVNRVGDDDNWSRIDHPTPEMKEVQTKKATDYYQARMGNLQMRPELADATREMARYCRRNGIGLAFIITPEDSRFRSWYGPTSEATFQEFAQSLRAEFGVPIVDGRQWVEDKYFVDPHHLMTEGSRRFTARLEREVLGPLVRGELKMTQAP